MRKFLYAIVVLLLLSVAVLFALRLYSEELTEIALVPSAEFVEQDALAANAYADPGMWFSRPGMGAPNDPARWQPPYAQVLDQAGSTGPQGGEPSPPLAPVEQIDRVAKTPADSAAQPERFAVFFVHPTSFYSPRAWNASFDDAETQGTARLMVRGMASAFNKASEIWAPRYRQATFGAFVSDSPQASRAIDTAYRDVAQAFEYFIARIDPDLPIVLAGHSQGALHLQRLLREKVQGSALQARVAAAYAIGWPISVEHDLPQLGLPACATPRQDNCIASWASFAEPADPGQFLRHYTATPGLDGQPRGETPILCVNPLTGTLNGTAGRTRNLGTLVPNDDMSSGELVRGAVGARCDEQGLLLIGDPPELGTFVLPGNNYHVYDIPLFWANLQRDVGERVKAWTQNRS